MVYERTELLCYILGAIAERANFARSTEDSLIMLDNILLDMNQLPVTNEEKEVINRMHEQMEIFNIQMGMNRETQRKLGLHHK
jgi:hypothetical protein